MTSPVPPGLDDWFITAMRSITKRDPDQLSSLLIEYDAPIVIKDSKTTFRCHFVAHDANGHPAVERIARALADEVASFCIPRRKLAEAVGSFHATGSTAAISRLNREAKQLFVDATTSGEGGELLLYLLLESHLRIPQILCKMNLKTNTNVHVHGTDGIHAKVADNGNLALYWGESKLHNSVSSAIDDCFTSITPFLKSNQELAIPRDLFLARDFLDAGEQELTAHLIRYFDDTKPQAMHLELRGACLVGFTLDNYPDINDVALRTAMTSRVETWRKRVGTNLSGHDIGSTEIELYCIPFPSVQALRDAVRNVIKE